MNTDAPKRPCKECPWRKDVPLVGPKAQWLGNRLAGLWWKLRFTRRWSRRHMFVCHMRLPENVACAGFSVVYARHRYSNQAATAHGTPLFRSFYAMVKARVLDE